MMQFHKLQLERDSSAITHYTGAETTNISHTRKKTEGTVLCATLFKWLSQNLMEFRKWNKEANWSVQICRLLTVAKGLITSSRMSLWSPTQKWGQLPVPGRYLVTAVVGSAGGDAWPHPGPNFGKLSWARFVTKEMYSFVFAC